ncbi:tetratricopeptide repeat-containing sulfotransferase family protein [Fulvimonas soli]|jgi:tetratricopeptide (TPR) repeat protein|uniref:Tetratricopeptide repeat protein n=1 Tax=Fulvimonas soli TaxID=155197 RepID=A0A316IGM1_9GAMM|nr:sulfotransferase [Fulvimonas soli]PWK92461.1 tetratricopeptide repeat protein [Fulvimonas soli]TNY25444.1 sulfotransferase family protein [Fulvimonas soli]
MNPAALSASPAALQQRIRQSLEAGKLEEAQAALESLIALEPANTDALIELADIMFKRGRFRASSRPLLQAARRLPRNAPLILELVQHLIARGEIVVARACLTLLAQAPDPPSELLVAQARMRFSLGELDEALALMRQAIRAGADAPGELHLYAMLLQFGGALGEAGAVLERCLERWPHFGDAAMVLVNLRKQKPESNRLAWLDEQLGRLPDASAGPDHAFNRAEFEYARFKTLDDLGRHNEAWDSLARCNALMHALNPYDADAEEAVTSALIAMPAVSAPVTAFEGPTPIFIVGMPRSGTTLLDRMLSSHSRITSAGEIIEFWRQLHWVADVKPARAEGLLRLIERSADIDYREVGARYLQQTQWRAQGRAYYIDKLPANIQMVAFIRRALPHAPILHMVRDPMDTCFSNFKAMFGNVSPYSYELGALAHYYRQYSRLVQHWRATLPGAMLEIPYAMLVQDPQTTLSRVLARCGLDVEQACLRPERNTTPVATPSSPQVRESIHTRGIGQWRSYARQLEPLRQALAISIE